MLKEYFLLSSCGVPNAVDTGCCALELIESQPQ